MTEDHETDEIRYDPVPGFRPAFFLIMALATLYLGFIFLFTGH